MDGLRVIDVVDLAIAITVVESVALLAWGRFGRAALPARSYLLNLVSGLCLMLALRLALAGAAWPWVPACLMAAGLAHGTDLWRKWQGERRP